MLKNRLYRFNRWFDRNELFKFGFMISYIAVAMLNLTTGSLTAFVLMMLIVCAFVVYRMFIMDNRVTFDRSHYDVPVVGEIVIVKKDFYYDGSFRRFINQSNPSQKPNWWKVSKGTELVILNVEETYGDWKIRFIEPTINSKTRGDLHLYYLDTKDYWDTKANIRSKILSKIGI
jgi:Ca2+/Na+ antiporter